jgi:transposase InsO family protein
MRISRFMVEPSSEMSASEIRRRWPTMNEHERLDFASNFHSKLVREGISANHKHVYRLYREEGLAMRIRQRRRIRRMGAVSNSVARRPNERWSMDFVSDCVSTGRVIRMLTVVDPLHTGMPPTRLTAFPNLVKRSTNGSRPIFYELLTID